VFGALLGIAAISLVNASTASASPSYSDAAIAKRLDALPVETVPGNIAHAATCNPSLPDVSAALQEWITSLPNNSVARLDKNQCYHTEYPITFGAKTLVVFDGNGSTFASFTDGCGGTRVGPKQFVNCRYPSPVDAAGRTQPAWPQARDHLHLIGNKQLILVNLHVEGGKSTPGYNADYAFQHGITITGTSDGTVISNVTVDHVWGDFVHLQSHYSPTTKTTTYPKDVTIENSHFGMQAPNMGSGREGFSIDDGTNIHVQNNVIQYSSRSLVDIEPVSTNAVLKEIYFEHNTFGPHSLNLFANHSYGDANPVIDGIYFRYNDLVGAPLQVDSVIPNVSQIDANNPATFRRHNYQFVGNHSDTMMATGTCPGPNRAMRFYGIDGLLVQDNVAPLGPNRCMALVDAAKLRNVRIANNSMQNAIRAAARYYQSASYCENGNMIGKPFTLDLSTLAPRCKN